ncbi:hypothetical protein M7I_2188 [Glarea lozoyensis 74030]|uniref:Uncharacterized protein n=1 Tax=Glarea lozoyensis (strain ATCC 74030 / MF5533) TaxID=1104152 RepID=H0EI41_GLAL7|nr:hypothetical protein M7I_2188 [Glarea lozoyensis 74030]
MHSHYLLLLLTPIISAIAIPQAPSPNPIPSSNTDTNGQAKPTPSITSPSPSTTPTGSPDGKSYSANNPVPIAAPEDRPKHQPGKDYWGNDEERRRPGAIMHEDPGRNRGWPGIFPWWKKPTNIREKIRKLAPELQRFLNMVLDKKMIREQLLLNTINAYEKMPKPPTSAGGSTTVTGTGGTSTSTGTGGVTPNAVPSASPLPPIKPAVKEAPAPASGDKSDYGNAEKKNMARQEIGNDKRDLNHPDAYTHANHARDAKIEENGNEKRDLNHPDAYTHENHARDTKVEKSEHEKRDLNHPDAYTHANHARDTKIEKSETAKRDLNHPDAYTHANHARDAMVGSAIRLPPPATPEGNSMIESKLEKRDVNYLDADFHANQRRNAEKDSGAPIGGGKAQKGPQVKGGKRDVNYLDANVHADQARDVNAEMAERSELGRREEISCYAGGRCSGFQGKAQMKYNIDNTLGTKELKLDLEDDSLEVKFGKEKRDEMTEMEEDDRAWDH